MRTFQNIGNTLRFGQVLTRQCSNKCDQRPRETPGKGFNWEHPSLLKLNCLTDTFNRFLNFSKYLFTKFWNYVFIAVTFHSGSQVLLKEFLNLVVSASFQIELLCNISKATSISSTVHAAAIFFKMSDLFLLRPLYCLQ